MLIMAGKVAPMSDAGILKILASDLQVGDIINNVAVVVWRYGDVVRNGQVYCHFDISPLDKHGVHPYTCLSTKLFTIERN